MKQKPVVLSRDAVARTERCVKAYESGASIAGGGWYPARDDSDPVRLGKTTAAWNKGTLATITLYESGTPPNEITATPAETLANCVNKFANVASGKWVIVARGPQGYWYLISAEC